ncbi:tetratricopeptide repeat protein [Flavobacterium sp.]
MKAILCILGFLFFIKSNAQTFDCSSKIKAYQEILKSPKSKDAFDIWTEVRKNCPKENEAVYTDGIKILQYKIETAPAGEKEKWVRDLMKLYDQYHKNFPSSVPEFQVYKGMALVNNKIDAKDEIFGLLDSGFNTSAKNVTDVKAIYTYFSIYCERFSAGDKKITANSVLEKYTMVSSLLTQLINSNPENSDYKTALNAVDILIKDIATCENLADFYAKNYTANQENADWITSALASLSGNCASKPIFLTLAEKLYSLRPTAQSAGFMALANTKLRKLAEATKFYEESAELQTLPAEKAKTYYTLATGFSASDPSKSKEYINKALASDPKMGKAYLYLSQLYINASKDCGKTEFEKKAVAYLAIQTAQKAGIVEPMLKPSADKMIENYAPKALTASEISKEKMNGKSITLGCWINETISFPNK